MTLHHHPPTGLRARTTTDFSDLVALPSRSVLLRHLVARLVADRLLHDSSQRPHRRQQGRHHPTPAGRERRRHHRRQQRLGHDRDRWRYVAFLMHIWLSSCWADAPPLPLPPVDRQGQRPPSQGRRHRDRLVARPPLSVSLLCGHPGRTCLSSIARTASSHFALPLLPPPSHPQLPSLLLVCLLRGAIETSLSLSLLQNGTTLAWEFTRSKA
jgi:hypothetical protein